MLPHLAPAIDRALSEVRELVRRLERRPGDLDVGEDLRQRAIAASGSPLAHDQLVAIACGAAADGRGRPAIDAALDVFLVAPDAVRQLEIRRAVLEAGADEVQRLDIASNLAREERRGVSFVGRKPGTLALYLRRAASLNRQLWDHPALLAAPAARAGMLAVVEALESRAVRLERYAPNVLPFHPGRGPDAATRPSRNSL